MAIPAEIQEISIARYRDQKIWDVWTTDSTFLTMMRKQGYKAIEKGDGYHHFQIPLNRVTVRKSAPRKPRKIKEGTRVKLAQNLVKARAARRAKA